jgi:putative redox protein
MEFNISVEYSGGTKFIARTRSHEITCDQPVANNGTDEGMTPPELLLASLGTCAAYYATQYLNTRNLPGTGVVVSVSAQKATAPNRLGSFRVTVTLPEALPEQHMSGVTRSIHACLIHNTLLHTPPIDLKVSAG